MRLLTVALMGSFAGVAVILVAGDFDFQTGAAIILLCAALVLAREGR